MPGMSQILSLRFYPKGTEDSGHDRNARTIQFTCLLFAIVVATVSAVGSIERETTELPILAMAMVGLVTAVVLNRAGLWKWAGRTAFLVVLLTAILLVYKAHDGFRSHAMLLFPGLLLISVMLLDRLSYMVTAATVLVVVALLALAEQHGLTHAVPGVRSATTIDSILNVDVILLLFASIGSRLARDAQTNVAELRATVGQLSAANLELTESAKALRDSELRYRRLYDSITDAILAVDMDGHIRETNPAYEAMLGYTGEELRRLTYQEITPEPWHGFEAKIVTEQILAKGRSEVYEKEYRRRDGTVFPVEIRSYLLRDETNRPAGMWAIVHDITERKQAESALRESEQRFRAAFYQAAVGIAQASLDGRWLVVNDRLSEILGYEADELIGKTFVDVTHPDDREACLSGVNALLAGEISLWSHEKRYVRKDGATVWARVFVTLVRDQHNQPEYFIGVIEDVTERMQAEHALRDAERHLTLAQGAAHLGVWDRDLQTDTVSLSGECARLYGLPDDRTTITREEWFNAVHPDDRDRLQAQIRETFDRRRTNVWDAEYRVVWPDSSLHWLVAKGTVFVDDAGRPAHVTGVTMEITDRKQAEAALRESELCYREVFNHFSECIFVLEVTPDGRFRIAALNPAEEKATGLSSAEVAGSFIDDVLPEDTARRAISHYQRCLEVGTVIHYDEELNLPAGARYFHSNLIPLRNDAGRIHRIVGCCLDFTDLKRAQEEAFARQKLESVGTLAGGIAHDFNNLLGAVLAQADLALAEYGADGSPREPLRAIQDLAMRGSEIVQQLMVYAGKDSEVPELVNVSWVVEEMLGLLKVSVSKHAALETDLIDRLPPVRGKAAQLRQIVMNLITNASEAIVDRDGIIRLTTRRVSVGRAAADLKGVDQGDYVELTVSDTGAGMSPDIQARVFDPFFTTKSAGRGLGLGVVHGIVRSLGGGIHIASEPGKGTTVQILLPCAEGMAGSIDLVSETCEPTRPSQKFTALVVEDEEPLRNAVVKMLRREDFEVLEASNGTAALELLRAYGRNIDLILLDMTIPGASSQDVVMEAAEAHPDIKVILTSAYSEEMLTDKINASHVHDFIRKPFRLGDLVKLLHSAVRN